jgi:signal peptidase I
MPKKGAQVKRKEKLSAQPSTIHALKSQAKEFFKEIIYTLLCVLVINSFVMASFVVPTGSMEDTVKVGDHLFVNKFIYGGTTPYAIPMTSIRIPHLRVPGFRNVSRGDVIVFDWPGNRDEITKPESQLFYLKRCVGIAGDSIRINNRIVYVNDRALPNPPQSKFLREFPFPEGYVNPDLFPRNATFNEDYYGPIVVPGRGMKLSLNAGNLGAWETFIEREGHSIDRQANQIVIDGRPTAEYTVQRDYVFAMGDNRDNSADSRFWGFVPVEDIVGTPMVVYWSSDPQISLLHIADKLRSIDLQRIGTIIR